MKKEEIMRIIQERKQLANKKKRDSACGRLIHWDMEAPRENVVMLDGEHFHTKSDVSTQEEKSPLVLAEEAQTRERVIAAINKTLDFHDMGYGSSQDPDYLCGRLIRWDVGGMLEDRIRLEDVYRHREYTLSPHVELKPYVAPIRVPGGTTGSSGLKPIAERYCLRHGISPKDFSKKQPPN